MPLPTPKLDDRKFQDIVDEVKRLIPQFCPEWTDHNVSDPGVTLIELFAWMTDMLLYRVNQVPDKMYIKFLELLGIRLAPPRPARVPVTFYLSAAQSTDITIPEGTEVATIRTETSPAIIFTTVDKMEIRTPKVTSVQSRLANPGGEPSWMTHDLRQLSIAGVRTPLFAPSPAPGDAVYFGFERDHSNHVMALQLAVDVAGGAGVDPTNPPWSWQVYSGGASRWSPAVVEYDGTGGFNVAGEIILRLPPMSQGAVQDVQGYWLRCVLTQDQSGHNAYRVTPELERMVVESRGGTVGAIHATTVNNEILGVSDGSAGQTFVLLNKPVLARDPNRDQLIVEPPGMPVERWTEVSDFGDSHAPDNHFTLDSLSGELTLGPALLQPDGRVYKFGAVPAKGSTLRFTRYQYGAGVAGNVPVRSLQVCKTSIPYVAHVTNWDPAVGGADAQSLEDAKLRAPQALRTRTRAVTADDFEFLAASVAGVARSRCIGPGSLPADPSDPKPGQVFVIVLPERPGTTPATPEELVLPPSVRRGIQAVLDEHRLLGTALDVREPGYTWISVAATLRVADATDALLVANVQQAAEQALYRFYDPHTGGPQGNGWPFGRSLHLSEAYGLLQRTPGVEYVDEVQVRLEDPISHSASRPAPPTLTLPRHGLICSFRHQIRVA